MSVGKCAEYVCEMRDIPMDESRPRVAWIDEMIDQFYYNPGGINLAEESSASENQKANARKQARKSTFGKFVIGD